MKLYIHSSLVRPIAHDCMQKAELWEDPTGPAAPFVSNFGNSL